MTLHCFNCGDEVPDDNLTLEILFCGIVINKAPVCRTCYDNKLGPNTLQETIDKMYKSKPYSITVLQDEKVNIMYKEQQYKVEVFDNIMDYWRAQRESGYRKKLLSFTETHYPKILALGFCLHGDKKTIYTLKVGNWRRRILHEVGHELKQKHSIDPHDVMFPYFWRGGNGEEEIKSMYYNKYGLNAYRKLLTILEDLK